MGGGLPLGYIQVGRYRGERERLQEAGSAANLPRAFFRFLSASPWRGRKCAGPFG